MRAYHQTSFFADTPRGRIRLRIREKSAELEAILFAEGAREWAYVTACNPGSRPLSHRENVRRQEALEREVSGRGLVFLRGEGVGDDGQWPPEPSLLILGIARDQAVDLGGRFGQKAIVFGETGGSPGAARERRGAVTVRTGGAGAGASDFRAHGTPEFGTLGASGA
jgi:hypothetical protein